MENTTKTIYIKGFADEINLAERLSDNYDLNWSFSFDEESSDTIENVFFRFYECDKVCTLEEAMKNNLRYLFGDLIGDGEESGYSEYSIDGFSVRNLRLGGHNLDKILKNKGHKYLHILIEAMNRTE